MSRRRLVVVVAALASIVGACMGQAASLPTFTLSPSNGSPASPDVTPASDGPSVAWTSTIPSPVASQATTLVAPDCYQEPKQTGHGRTEAIRVDVPDGCVVLVEGYLVGDLRGVFRALAGPVHATYRVTDGQVVFVSPSVAHDRFCSDIGIARQEGDFVEHVYPLAGWDPC